MPARPPHSYPRDQPRATHDEAESPRGDSAEAGRLLGIRLSTEQQLVLACIPIAFGQAGIRLPERAADWELALRFATRQGVAPLFHRGASRLGLAIPAGVRTKLRALDLAAVARAETFVRPLLRQVVGALAARGLEPIVLKGAALADLVYPRPADRSFGDLDLLLPPDQAERAAAVLRELGFRTKDTEPEVAHHLAPYFSSESPLGIDLHHRLLAEPHPFRPDLDAIRARARPARLGQVEARVLAPPDALLLTCVHLAASDRYRYFPLRALTDILAITTVWRAELDWDDVLELVRRSRTAGAVYWPLQLSRLWLRAPVPDHVLAGLAPPPAIRRLVALVAESGALLDLQAPEHDSAFSAMLATFVLRTGYSTSRLLPELLEDLFPPAERVPRLAPEYRRSRLRYAAHLVRPTRLARGLAAVRRGLRRLRQP